jgi:hypothetical protein
MKLRLIMPTALILLLGGNLALAQSQGQTRISRSR